MNKGANGDYDPAKVKSGALVTNPPPARQRPLPPIILPTSLPPPSSLSTPSPFLLPAAVSPSQIALSLPSPSLPTPLTAYSQ